MSENIAQTVQKAIQDILAPDVRELKVMVADLQKQMDTRFAQMDTRFAQMGTRFAEMQKQMDTRFAEMQKQMDTRFADMQKQMELRFEMQTQKADLQFSAIIAAISESRAHAELTSFQRIATISERVTVLEAHRQ